jgi:hypothetical protein
LRHPQLRLKGSRPAGQKQAFRSASSFTFLALQLQIGGVARRVMLLVPCWPYLQITETAHFEQVRIGAKVAVDMSVTLWHLTGKVFKLELGGLGNAPKDLRVKHITPRQLLVVVVIRQDDSEELDMLVQPYRQRSLQFAGGGLLPFIRA